MFCVKRAYDRGVIINKCLGLKDLKSNKRYIFFYELWLKLWVFHRHVSLKVYSQSFKNIVRADYLKVIVFWKKQFVNLG